MFILGFSLIGSIGLVQGIVIEEVVVCHDFDASGCPIPQNVFPTSTDAVLVWVNMTDIHTNDTLVFEWWPPAGNLYDEQEWRAPYWTEDVPSYSRFTEIEIMGEEAENMPGEWAINIYNNGTWWGHVVFELVNEDISSLPDRENLPTNIIGILNVELPDSFNEGDNVSVSVQVGYNFSSPTDIAPSIWNNNSQTFVGSVEDTVNGLGIKTYDIDFIADAPGIVYYAVAYYVSGDEITYSEEAGLVPFHLEDENTDNGIKIPSIEDLGLPTDIDLDEIQNQIGDYVSQLKDAIPDDLTGIEDEIKERTGIPGYPVGALILGLAALMIMNRIRS
ncbi:hypothetical protein GF326_03060 [Candidatus Bathyarchaeota archaeon]|nr:hypothetical protein [Candidatus Bathyarchaeota archaeon]